LTKALNNNLIAGAVLDITKDEFAAPEDPLFHLSDVLLTPHIAAITSEAKYNSAMMAAEDIHRCLSGEAPFHEVKKQLF